MEFTKSLIFAFVILLGFQSAHANKCSHGLGYIDSVEKFGVPDILLDKLNLDLRGDVALGDIAADAIFGRRHILDRVTISAVFFLPPSNSIGARDFLKRINDLGIEVINPSGMSDTAVYLDNNRHGLLLGRRFNMMLRGSTEGLVRLVLWQEFIKGKVYFGKRLPEEQEQNRTGAYSRLHQVSGGSFDGYRGSTYDNVELLYITPDNLRRSGYEVPESYVRPLGD